MLNYRFFPRLFLRLLPRSRPPQQPASSTLAALASNRNAWRSASYLLLPLLSMIVFLVAMLLILWNLNRHEHQQQQDALYRDAAWAQQQIHLSITNAQEQVTAIAQDIINGHQGQAHFRALSVLLRQKHPEIIGIDWIDSSHALHWPDAAPLAPSLLLGEPPHALMEGLMQASLDEARNARHQTYSALLSDNFGNTYITLQTPIFRDRQFLGSIATVFSIARILAYHVEPELSSKYKIALTDSNHRELASSSNRPPSPHDIFYERPLDPPGQGLWVRLYAYPHKAFVHDELIWLIAGLSCFVLWSLWILWLRTRQHFEAQQALYAEMFFRRAMENSVLIGMQVLDMQGRITHVNPALCRMSGWSEVDLVGKTAPFSYWAAEHYSEMWRQLDLTLHGKAPASGFEVKMQRKDGTFFYARLYVSPLVDSSGHQTGWMTSVTDITEPKRAREELAAAHERFTTVLESLDAAVSVLAIDDSELLFANRYYRQLFGIRPVGHLELTGISVDTTHSEQTRVTSDSADLVDTYAGLPALALTETHADTREIYAHSKQKWFEVRRQYIQWVDGRLAQMQIATDITARHQSEERARQHDEQLHFTSRLTTMGEMASSLAHELNQPLAAISNYCAGATALIENGRATSETLLPVLHKTAQQALRAGMIIKRIREFVKRSEPKRQPTQLADIIADAVGLTELEIRKHQISVIVDLHDPLPVINVDPILIEQVLINLIKNAEEAMLTDPPSTPNPCIRVAAHRQGDALYIRVIDQGPGINKALTEQLFEPFFSTKVGGMGMGLNICRSIIESHRGRLWVENNEADGTLRGCTFHIYLPLVDAAHSSNVSTSLDEVSRPHSLQSNQSQLTAPLQQHAGVSNVARADVSDGEAAQHK